MSNSIEHHYEIIKWASEYVMLPLHLLTLAHYYSVAAAIGGLVFVLYSTATIRHLREERQRG